MKHLALALVVLLVGVSAPGSRAATREMRVYSVETGLDPGDGSGTPPSDYYLDGGTAEGLVPGMLLPVFRSIRVDSALGDRTHLLRMHVGELQVLRVYRDSAIARVAGIQPAADAPLFEARAVMIGDYVPGAASGSARGGETLAPAVGDGSMTAEADPIVAEGSATPDEARPGETESSASHDREFHAGAFGSGAGPGAAGPSARGAARATLPRGWSLPAAPEAFQPGFPSASRWYPLPPPVLFRLDSADLDPPARDDLEGIALMLKRNPERLLALEGRTCDLGDARYNHALSLRRARTVAAFLQSRGVAAERVSVTALGESRPVRPNASEADRRFNRRVDLSLGSVGPTLEPEIPGTR